MLDIQKIRGTLKIGGVRLIIVAIGAYASIDIAIALAGFINELSPRNWFLASCEQDNCYWLPTTFGLLVSFSITGFLFGICLWVLYEKSAKQLVKFLPLFGLLALYIWRNRLMQAYSLPVGDALKEVIQMLTNSWGLSYFVFLPLSVFVTILLMEKYSYKQIARVALLVVAFVVTSRFIYTLTPQYQQEQAEREKIKVELQQAQEEAQRAYRRLERTLERTREGY